MFKIIVGVFFAAITSLAAADGHGDEMDICIAEFAEAQIGTWKGDFRFWNQAENRVVDSSYEMLVTKTANNTLKFIVKNELGVTETENPIAKTRTGSPNWIKEPATTFSVTSCEKLEDNLSMEVAWSGTNALNGIQVRTVEQTNINLTTGSFIGSSRTTNLDQPDQPAFIWGLNTGSLQK